MTIIQGNALILKENLYDFEKRMKKIADISKKLDKHFSYIIGEEQHQEKIINKYTHREKRIFIPYLPVSIEYEELKLNNYKLIAKVEALGDRNLIHKFDESETVPERYKQPSMHCDHCNSSRYRKHLFIIKDEKTGEYFQVGKSCLKDFTGHMNPETVAQWYEFFQDIEEDETKDVLGYLRSNKPDLSLKEFLAEALILIKEKGFIKSLDGSFDGKIIPAGREAFDNITKNLLTDKPEPQLTEEEKELIDNVIQWAKSLENESNDYLYNLSVIANSEIVTWKTKGYAASMFITYKKSKLRQEQQERKETNSNLNEFYGNIKDKIEIEVTLINKYEFYTQYGESKLYVFNDNEGRTFTWFSGTYQKVEKGDKLKIKATIKEHKEYNGINQTVLTRCKLIKIN